MIELERLRRELDACWKSAKSSSGKCHHIAGYAARTGHDRHLLVTQELITDHSGNGAKLLDIYPDAIPADFAAAIVGINPYWPDRGKENLASIRRLDDGKKFHRYKEQILSKLPSRSMIAHLELVQCGSCNGNEAWDVINVCQPKFFDKVVALIKPKVIVTIGRLASERLFEVTIAANSGGSWEGIKRRHATYEPAFFGDHRCAIVFVKQPSGWVSKEGRQAAAEAIAQAYKEFS